jgi:uncharacterized protein (TIGR04255 family)
MPGPLSPNLRPVVTNVWRFSSADRTSTISLTTEAVTFESLDYPGRTAFIARWSEILRWVQNVFAPSLTLRTGMRFINRIRDDSLEHLPEWIEPNLVGVALPELRSHVVQALSEANLRIEEGDLVLRWGIVPPHGTYDIGLLEPLPEASWILDIDAFSVEQMPFDTEVLNMRYRQLAERCYAMFRWAMTENGLHHFGADA